MVGQPLPPRAITDCIESIRSALFPIAQCTDWQGRVPRLAASRGARAGCSKVYLFTREQRRSARARTLVSMQFLSIKATVTTVWISAVCAAAIAGNFKSLSAWAVLAGVAVLPPLVMMWWWNNPRQTMSESIQEALR